MQNTFEVHGELVIIFLNTSDGARVHALIDLSDFDKVNEFDGTWYCVKNAHDNKYYIHGTTRVINGKQQYVRLHRLILDAPKELVVDHINRDTMDNRRKNLRLVTKSQNSQNTSREKKNSSGIRGISWLEKQKRWVVRLTVNGKYHYIGKFKELSDAEKALSKARAELMPYSPEASSQ